jgi:formylglycine-generating enzyme required for sulfatase activity
MNNVLLAPFLLLMSFILHFTYALAQETTDTKMAKIPAGDFIMGSSAEELDRFVKEYQAKYPQTQRWFFEDEAPKHTKNLGAILIDKFEVTNSEYQEFLRSDDGESVEPPSTWSSRTAPPGKRNHPVAGVNKFQAQSYCKFRGKRLPTEAEWEKASRGPNGLIFPWGDQYEGKDVNTAELKRFDTTQVGIMKDDVSQYGVYDLGGNVMELVQDGYHAYTGNDAASKKTNETFSKREGWAVARGGSFESPIYDARGAGRRFFSPTHQGKDIGFRCARDDSR